MNKSKAQKKVERKRKLRAKDISALFFNITSRVRKLWAWDNRRDSRSRVLPLRDESACVGQ